MNLAKLREMLSEQMTLLRDGKSEAKNVNAMVNAAGKVISSVRLEMDYARMVGVAPKIKFIEGASLKPAKRLA